MKKPSARLGCVLAVLLAAIGLVLVGTAWWFFIGQYTMAPVGPSSPVQVFLLSPSSGDDVAAGDFVQVDLQAVAPQAISWSEVFVDGTSLGAITESPESVSWTWQAWPAGVHVLAGRSQAADGQLGESQTVIVNVVVADETMQVLPGPSETLAQMGAKFGVPPAQMAAANPKLDPSKPLTDGKPVNVPTGGGSQPPDGGGGPGGGSAPFFIHWELKLTGQVDKSYCYLSDGSGTWDKMPTQPFEFFGGLDNFYSQVFDVTPPSGVTFQAQCWGWLGGALKYLGQGVTKPIGEGPIQVIADGFQLTGLPKWPETKEEKFLGGGGPTVPPPFALRESKDAADCTAHAAPIVGPFICNTLMNAKVKEYLILEWEWQPGLPAPDKNWANDIEGYEIYEILPDTGAPPKFLKTVKPMGAKAAALPLPWHNYCYGVNAFANVPAYGGKLVSEMATYCAGESPATKTITQTPSHWMTTGGEWISTPQCDTYPPPGLGAGGVGPQKPEILVGSYVQTYGDCYLEGSFAGAVKFSLTDLPPGTLVQKASLKFSKVFLFYDATGVAPGAKPQICAQILGKGVKDWTGIINALHYAAAPGLISFSNPYVSIGQYMPSPIDVTSIVKKWVEHPPLNHGFVFYPVSPPQPKVEDGDYGTGDCESQVGDFQLEINYFAP